MAEKSKVIESLMPFWKKGIPVYTVQIEFLLFLSSIIIRKKIIMKNFDILFKCCVFLVLMHFSNNCLYASTDTISRRHKVTLREAHVGDLDVDTRLLDNYGLLPENIREFYYTSWDDHDYFNNDLAGIPKGFTAKDRDAVRSVWHENWNNPENDGVLGESGQTNFVDFSTKGRSQFIKQLEEFVNGIEQTEPEELEKTKGTEETETLQTEVAEQKPTDEIDLSDDATEPQEEIAATPAETAGGNGGGGNAGAEDLEKVMNNGMQFLSGLFKMATGKEMGMENQKIEVNKETGEVTMKFKLPV
jgi:hypothetical protein